MIDINLNKEFVRNYELAARRLEAVLMQKIDPDKIKEFDRILKEEVKDFLGLTTTGNKLQELDYKINVASNEMADMKQLILPKIKEIDAVMDVNGMNLPAKIAQMEANMNDIFTFYNKY